MCIYIYIYVWVVVKIMVPFWVPIIVRHLIFRVPKKGTLILTTTHIYIYICIYIYSVCVYTHDSCVIRRPTVTETVLLKISRGFFRHMRLALPVYLESLLRFPFVVTLRDPIDIQTFNWLNNRRNCDGGYRY